MAFTSLPSLRFLVVAPLVSLAVAAGAFAQNAATPAKAATGAPAKPAIVLSLLDAPKGDTAAATIAQTVTQSMELMLRLTGRFNVQSADFLNPVVSYDRSVLYYRRLGAKIGIFGKVTPDSAGGYTIDVQLWRPGEKSGQPKSFTKKISDVFSVFDAADQLALTVASEAVGKSLAVGTLVIKNQAKLGNYGVYVDGQLIGRSMSTAKVLTGKRTVIVAVPGPLGDQPVQTFHVDITADKPSVITLTKNPKLAKAQAKPASKQPSAAEKTAPKPTGGLTVTSNPAGAMVKLNRKVIGTTPLHLFGVPVGTYRLTLDHPYFRSIETVAQISDHGDDRINVKLRVNPKDPTITKRMIRQKTAVIDSAIWSGLQGGNLVGSSFLSKAAGATTEFWKSTPNNGFQTPIGALGMTMNAMFFRIGNRIAEDPLQAGILDGASALAALLNYNVIIPESAGSTPTTLSTALSTIGSVLFAATVVYDVASSPFAVTRANDRTLAYVQAHGVLPPLHVNHAHHIIVETGGGSFVRGGYSYPLVPDYLSVVGTLGAGFSDTASSISAVGLSAALRLSYNPFGTVTGAVRPELNLGVRATTSFSSVNASLDLGTGNDWVGRSFDIFTRGGVSYNLTAKHFGEYLTIGTRLF